MCEKTNGLPTMRDCHTTPPQRIYLALNVCLRNWRLRTRSGSSHRQIHKIVKPPWCAVPTRGVRGIVDFKVLFDRHAVKSNVPELRSHKVSWQIQPRHSRYPGHRGRKDLPQRVGGPDLSVRHAGLICLTDTRRGSRNSRYVNAIVLRTGPNSGSTQPAASLSTRGRFA